MFGYIARATALDKGVDIDSGQADDSVETKFLVRASYLQIYNEIISDLIKPERASLQIR